MENKAKKMGLISLIAMAIGSIIGSGVFTMLPATLTIGRYMTPIGVLTGGLAALIYTMPYIFVSGMFNLESGIYSVSSALYPKSIAGIVGIIQQVCGSLGFTNCAIGIASYTLQLFPGDHSNLTKPLQLGYIALFFLIAVVGVSGASKVQNIMTAALMVALLIYGFGGLPHVDFSVLSFSNMFDGVTPTSFLQTSVFMASTVFGATVVYNFSSEVKNPKRDIPLSMILSTLIVIALNVVLAIVTVGILPVDDVAGKNLGIVAEAFMSRPVYLYFMIGGAIMALATTMNASISSLKYPYMKMVEDGWLPAFLGKVDKKFNYPYIMMGILFLVGGVMPVCLGWDIITIISVFSLPLQLINVINAILTIGLPKRYPERWAGCSVKMPMLLYYIISVGAVIITAFFFYSYFTAVSIQMVIASLGASALVAAYMLYRYKTGKVNVSAIE